ncbi:ABC transporter permease [Streptomyces sp. WAC05374]|uniref:ABC transporter permease n=1 Tax=Streptomyces sp. WAC05374 TaxID=2487420 RepID=UPI000F86870E|nr:ABC transporter permease [Streptomyces sp. WAC05374]RST00502.1 ABC transporter permease [Streptomyces sp. WAC05374]TDF47391.1 ABC transporter permease [Streptomyces sp. WAC05374]TDF57650.1 ABC transporter permease [Streptomyces sp. WAC05374]TDF61754.1 ABC transporter permease [Streptomyces sp. WAC05374]
MTTHAHQVTPARVLRSEWHKLWTLRSTWITALSASAVTLGIGLVMGVTYTSGGNDADIDTVVLVLYGTMLSQIVLAVLGVLVTAGEYATGMIRASLTAVPRRTPVLWAKAAVFAATVYALSLLTALATFLGAQLFLADTDQAASLTDPGVLRAIAGNSAGLTLVGLLALGLGALLRSVPGALGAFVGGVVILPEILTMLPYEAVDTAVAHFPTQAFGALGSATPLPGAAGPGAALLALCLWAGASLGAAALLMKRRDV